MSGCFPETGFCWLQKDQSSDQAGGYCLQPRSFLRCSRCSGNEVGSLSVRLGLGYWLSNSSETWRTPEMCCKADRRCHIQEVAADPSKWDRCCRPHCCEGRMLPVVHGRAPRYCHCSWAYGSQVCCQCCHVGCPNPADRQTDRQTGIRWRFVTVHSYVHTLPMICLTQFRRFKKRAIAF